MHVGHVRGEGPGLQSPQNGGGHALRGLSLNEAACAGLIQPLGDGGWRAGGVALALEIFPWGMPLSCSTVTQG